MAAISGVEAVMAVLARWQPGDLAFIERLEYSAASEDAGAAIAIDAVFQRSDHSGGWPSASGACCRVSMVFANPVNLSLKSFGTPAKQIMGFYIEDISERQLEGICFSVGDYKDGDIEFLCWDVRILSAEPVPGAQHLCLPRLAAANPVLIAVRISAKLPALAAAEQVCCGRGVLVERGHERVQPVSVEQLGAFPDRGDGFRPERLKLLDAAAPEEFGRIAAVRPPLLLLPAVEAGGAVGNRLDHGRRHRLPLAIAADAVFIGEGRAKLRVSGAAGDAPRADGLDFGFGVDRAGIDKAARLLAAFADGFGGLHRAGGERVWVVVEFRQPVRHGTLLPAGAEPGTHRRLQTLHVSGSKAACEA